MPQIITVRPSCLDMCHSTCWPCLQWNPGVLGSSPSPSCPSALALSGPQFLYLQDGGWVGKVPSRLLAFPSATPGKKQGPLDVGDISRQGWKIPGAGCPSARR